MRRYLTTLSWISKIIKALENVFDVTDAEQGGMISTDEYENSEFSISAMCRVLQINRNGYYAWKTELPSKRAIEDKKLITEIKQFFDDSYGIYGSPRIHRDLREAGIRCSEKRVARLMTDSSN